MISELLKEHTQTNHQQLEKLLVGRMKSIRSTEQYIDLLQLFYSYFSGLEEKIDQYITANELADYEQRRKSQALANDIAALGSTPREKASDTALPVIQNTLQAYGALYVIEGSTLGGKIISKMMAQQLGIKNGEGLTFFNGYGDNTDLMWDAFKESLNSQVKSEGEAADIIESANQTFEKFKQWAVQQV